MPISVNDLYENDKLGKPGRADITEIYDGTTRIKEVYDGSNRVFLAENIDKLCDSDDAIGNFTVDGTAIYAFRDSGFININLRSGKISSLLGNMSGTSLGIGSVSLNHFCTNGSLILAMDYHNNYVWYDISARTYSDIYQMTDAPAVCSPCCMDDTYSYFAYKNTLVRINNTTKEATTFTHTINIPERMVVDSKYVYIFDPNSTCYVFDKNTSTISQFATAPDGVVFSTASARGSYFICQNNTHIFQFCMCSDGNYNRILVTDKENKTTRLLPPITELPGDTNSQQHATITCSDKYLFAASNTKIYIFDLSGDLTSYKTVDISAYRDSNPRKPAIVVYSSYTGNLCVTFDNRVYKKQQALLYINAKN